MGQTASKQDFLLGVAQSHISAIDTKQAHRQLRCVLSSFPQHLPQKNSDTHAGQMLTPWDWKKKKIYKLSWVVSTWVSIFWCENVSPVFLTIQKQGQNQWRVCLGIIVYLLQILTNLMAFFALVLFWWPRDIPSLRWSLNGHHFLYNTIQYNTIQYNTYFIDSSP